MCNDNPIHEHIDKPSKIMQLNIFFKKYGKQTHMFSVHPFKKNLVKAPTEKSLVSLSE